MKYIKLILAMGLALATALILFAWPGQPAGANLPPATRSLPYLWHSNDTGYYNTILFRCVDGGAQGSLPEGGRTYCDYPKYVYVRTGEELWCYRWSISDDGYWKHWVKVGDATGWYTMANGRWDYGGCTIREDIP